MVDENANTVRRRRSCVSTLFTPCLLKFSTLIDG
nr:MAG TPA_asm: hypothetical protein [Caudoviricetes sp.]